MKSSLPIIFLLLITVGCTPRPAQNAHLVSNTATIQPTISKISPSTETPSLTPRPTLTQKPTIKATRIRPTIPVATLNAQATLEPFEKLCDEFESDSSRSSVMSPNGDWFAISCGYKRNQKLILLNQEGKKWVFDFETLLRPKLEGMPGAFELLSWSPDGRFLYFSKVLGYSGGGNQCFPGFGVYGLYRLHLQSGTLVTLVPSRDDGFPGDEIKFSPTNEYYAVDIGGVRITNLVNGKATKIDVSGVMDMSWSPDGKFLAFSVASCGDEFVESSSMLVWNSITNQTQVLFSTKEMLLKSHSWVDNSKIRFEGETWVGNNYSYTEFEYNLAENKMVSSGTAMPRP